MNVTKRIANRLSLVWLSTTTATLVILFLRAPFGLSQQRFKLTNWQHLLMQVGPAVLPPLPSAAAVVPLPLLPQLLSLVLPPCCSSGAASSAALFVCHLASSFAAASAAAASSAASRASCRQVEFNCASVCVQRNSELSREFQSRLPWFKL